MIFTTHPCNSCYIYNYSQLFVITAVKYVRLISISPSASLRSPDFTFTPHSISERIPGLAGPFSLISTMESYCFVIVITTGIKKEMDAHFELPRSSARLTLRPMRHQVHLAVRALSQFTYVLVLLGYICCWQGGDGQGLHVLHGHPSAVTHLRCRRAPAAAHLPRPSWRKGQARLDTVGQTEERKDQTFAGLHHLNTECWGCIVFNVIFCWYPYIPVNTLCPTGWLNTEGPFFLLPSIFREGIDRGMIWVNVLVCLQSL